MPEILLKTYSFGPYGYSAHFKPYYSSSAPSIKIFFFGGGGEMRVKNQYVSHPWCKILKSLKSQISIIRLAWGPWPISLTCPVVSTRPPASPQERQHVHKSFHMSTRAPTCPQESPHVQKNIHMTTRAPICPQD